MSRIRRAAAGCLTHPLLALSGSGPRNSSTGEYDLDRDYDGIAREKR